MKTLKTIKKQMGKFQKAGLIDSFKTVTDYNSADLEISEALLVSINFRNHDGESEVALFDFLDDLDFCGKDKGLYVYAI